MKNLNDYSQNPGFLLTFTKRVEEYPRLKSERVTDQEQDAGTGLYNYDARLYDPEIGQFVMADAIVPDPFNPQSLNRYAYVLNNPVRYVDPTGHEGDTGYGGNGSTGNYGGGGSGNGGGVVGNKDGNGGWGFGTGGHDFPGMGPSVQDDGGYSLSQAWAEEQQQNFLSQFSFMEPPSIEIDIDIDSIGKKTGKTQIALCMILPPYMSKPSRNIFGKNKFKISQKPSRPNISIDKRSGQLVQKGNISYSATSRFSFGFSKGLSDAQNVTAGDLSTPMGWAGTIGYGIGFGTLFF